VYATGAHLFFFIFENWIFVLREVPNPKFIVHDHIKVLQVCMRTHPA
jgi:hypothetical protein